MKKHRILMAPMEICGIMLKIHHEFERQGIKHDFLTFYEYAFAGDNMEYENKNLRSYFKIVQKCRKNRERGNTLLVRLWQIPEMFCVLGIFLKVLFLYDTFLLFYGMGLFYCTHYLRRIERMEFMIYRLFHKRVVVLYFGSDSRPPYCGKVETDVESLYKQTKETARRVQMIEKYATVIDSPASAQFRRRPFVVYNRIFPIMEAEELMMPKARSEREKVVILHAPSVQRWKGTKEVRELIRKLQDKGEPVEYVEISGQPHEKVMEAIGDADIVIDQMYSDVPMASFATEASLNGIPVVVCSYYTELCEKEFQFDLPPLCFCGPEEAEQRVRELIHNKELRKSMGEKEREYVQRHYMAEDVIERLIKMIDRNIPEEWYFDPKEASYVWGWGNKKEEIERKVGALADTYGFDALCLNPRAVFYSAYQIMYQEYRKKMKENI